MRSPATLRVQQPVPTNVPQNEPDKTHKHSVDSFMHSSQCPPLKTSVFGPSLSHWGSVRVVTTYDPGGIPQLVVQGPVISKAVHLHHNDQLAYHLWISAVTMLQCMASLSTWFQLNTRGSYSVAHQSLYLWTVRLLKTDNVRTSTLFLTLTPTNTCLTYQFDHLLP